MIGGVAVEYTNGWTGASHVRGIKGGVGKSESTQVLSGLPRSAARRLISVRVPACPSAAAAARCETKAPGQRAELPW